MYVNLTDNTAAGGVEITKPTVATGQYFTVWAQGTFGSGTLKILADEGDGTKTAIYTATASTDPTAVQNPGSIGALYYELTGATSPDINLNVVSEKAESV